jgi:hypothetical protein
MSIVFCTFEYIRTVKHGLIINLIIPYIHALLFPGRRKEDWILPVHNKTLYETATETKILILSVSLTTSYAISKKIKSFFPC